MKEFDAWNEVKKDIERTGRLVYVRPREIWWTSLGVNIGAEVDGKHENFERPVIIMKVYNRQTLLVLPLTSKAKDDQFHYKIQIHERTSWVSLTQSRVISSKRLLRKMHLITRSEFEILKTVWKLSL